MGEIDFHAARQMNLISCISIGCLTFVAASVQFARQLYLVFESRFALRAVITSYRFLAYLLELFDSQLNSAAD